MHFIGTKIFPLIALSATLVGCVSSNVTTPPVEIQVEQSNEDWQEYRVNRVPEAAPERDGGWRSQTAWGHPPAQRDGVTVDQDIQREELAPIGENTGRPTEQSSVPFQMKSDWADANVSSVLLPQFRAAALEAKRNGKASFVAVGTGSQFKLSKLWDGGDCSSIEVLILPEGGSLPIISRGTVEVCGDASVQ